MGDDLTDMGISATAAAAMGREQVVLAHRIPPKPSPDLGNVSVQDANGVEVKIGLNVYVKPGD